MKLAEQTTQQLERFIRKIAAKFPQDVDATMMTDQIGRAHV